MFKIIGIVILFCSAIIVFSSCASTLPPLPELSKEDASARIIVWDAGYKLYTITGSVIDTLFDPNFSINIPLLDAEPDFSSSISPFGTYLATKKKKTINVSVHLNPKSVDFSLYDVRKKEFVLDCSSDAIAREYGGDGYEVPWSQLDNGFFIISSDTIFKFYPDGSHKQLCYKEGIKNFSVSPSEQRILIATFDSVMVYDMITGKFDFVLDVGGVFSGKHYIRGISWSPEERTVAFGAKWTLYTYDLRKKKLSEIEAKATVFDTEPFSEDEFLFVEGQYPSEMSQLSFSKYFRICKVSLDTGERSVIYERDNHEPFSVKPMVSPSGKLILFSDPKTQSGYEVKLMSIDGKFMNTICDGNSPIWKK